MLQNRKRKAVKAKEETIKCWFSAALNQKQSQEFIEMNLEKKNMIFRVTFEIIKSEFNVTPVSAGLIYYYHLISKKTNKKIIKIFVKIVY